MTAVRHMLKKNGVPLQQPDILGACRCGMALIYSATGTPNDIHGSDA